MSRTYIGLDGLTRAQCYAKGFEDSQKAWLEKTEWVQTEYTFGLIACDPDKHRADILKDLVAQLREELALAKRAQGVSSETLTEIVKQAQMNERNRLIKELTQFLELT